EADIATAIAAGGITLSTHEAITVSDAVTVAQANSFQAATDGVITATLSDHAAGTLAGLNGTGNAYTVTVTGSADAADLNTIDGATTVTVDASGVTALTGVEADIANAIAAGGITLSTHEAVTVSDAVTVAQANGIQAVTDGVITATLSDTSAATLAGLNGTGNAYTVTVAAGSAAAADLNAIDAATTVAVGASAVTTLTGLEADIATAVAAGGITLSTHEAITVSDAVTVAQANSFQAVTDGVITATLSDTSAATLAGLNGTGNAYTVTVTGSANAADLNTIDGATTVTVDASGVTTLTGLESDIATAVAAGGITLSTHEAITVSDAVTVAQANSFQAATDGVITATLSDTSAATLAGLNGTGNAYTVTVTGSADAGDLNTIDAATTVTVDASGVTALTGVEA
ncbi:beta strand repeat-containing protein, partial [Geomonas limicola]|uniref:beta strand repeat-containing protein n=1 Tax=Geomonas limicola TaxID=2740186 RepID=UPI00160B0D6B